MPAKVAPFGEWLPDLADAPSHLKVATNVRAIANGYAPVRDWQAVTTGLGGQCLGGGAFRASDGTTSLIAGTISALWRYSSGVWTGLISDTATARWRMTQFGDNVICSNGTKLISYNLAAGTAGQIASAPTNCIDVATVRDFVMTLRDDDVVEWCEFNNSANWGTGDNQADTQQLLDGGAGVALVGGEYGLILQKNCIRRAQYVGGDIVFQFDVISPEIGCMAQGSVANVGRLVFFLSERGFQMCNGVDVSPIGDEKFNRWFFSRFPREDIQNIWAAIDTRSSLVMWAMPGEPGTIIAYNWVLQRATVISVAVTAMFNGYTSNISIDGVDALYPTGLDDVPVSLDSALFQGGNPLLLIVDDDHYFGTLDGANLEAAITVPAVEPTPGRRSRIRTVRPITDATSAEITVDARLRRGGAESVRSASSLRLNGKANIRSNGRYNDVTVSIPAGEVWTDIQGVEIEFEAGDGR